MKERGMIFNAEMVRAILSGQKTQIRRIMKVQPDEDGLAKVTNGPWVDTSERVYKCPYGAVGDRIWVRETWAQLGNEDGWAIDWNDNLIKDAGAEAARIYRASCTIGDYGLWQIPDDVFWKPNTNDWQYEETWRPSIHMPRWASRITLEITSVRVERLNDISEEDARAEGVGSAVWFAAKGVPESEWTSLGEHGAMQASHINTFATLWESIYGEESWQANPFVWVISFRRLEACSG